jgi:arabinose-5-phosphate isomerase
MNIVEEAKKVFDIEIQALQIVKDSLGDSFSRILNEIVNTEGKIVVTGMGKSGHIGAKIASTFASLGTPSFFLHPAEAQHGDLGMVEEKDLIIAISYSGESDEVIRLLPNLRMLGTKIIAITRNKASTLAKNSDYIISMPNFEEADPLGLAPTSSTTATLLIGDALAVVASKKYGFTSNDFGKNHPAGALGKKLFIKVKDIMHTADLPQVKPGSPVKDVIIEQTSKLLGLVMVIDDYGKLQGIVTPGDIGRFLKNNMDISQASANQIMTTTPKTISSDEMAVNALNKMKTLNVYAFPVVDEGTVKGIIQIKDIIKEGIL